MSPYIRRYDEEKEIRTNKTPIRFYFLLYLKKIIILRKTAITNFLKKKKHDFYINLDKKK